MRGDFFQSVSAAFDTNLIAAINSVIANGLAWAQPQIRAAATQFVLLTGWLVLTRRMDKNVFAGRIVRIVAVTALLLSASNFNTFVRDLFLTEIPSTVGAALTGGTTYAPAAQFDALWNATQRMAATVLASAMPRQAKPPSQCVAMASTLSAMPTTADLKYNRTAALAPKQPWLSSRINNMYCAQ